MMNGVGVVVGEIVNAILNDGVTRLSLVIPCVLAGVPGVEDCVTHQGDEFVLSAVQFLQ